MDFLELAKTCRTVRRYDESKEVGYERLLHWVECARVSSSAANQQPLRYRIVSSPEDCAKVFPHLKWAGALKDWDGPAQGERPRGYIVIFSEDAGPFAPVDLGIASQTIMLAAAHEGYGCCMFKAFARKSLQEALGVDGAKTPVELVMAFGIPAEKVILERLEDSPCGLSYWRDEQGVHHVPKRAIEDILI